LEAPLDATPDLRSLPQPSDEQYREFAKHVGEAHSWYKHLPLLTGGQFVVFLAPDSALGNLVLRLDDPGHRLVPPPEGPLFTEANPRLHYSWKTTEEYRRRFGYLDYACRTREDARFGRDAGGEMALPAALRERCTFTLFAYVAGNGIDSVRWAHQEAVEKLRVGGAHPQREAVLEWARLAEAEYGARRRLTDAEHKIVLRLAREGSPRPETTAAIDRYLGINAELEAVYYDVLRPGELAKIRNALEALRAWLEGR
jgi:hypothetical protein